MRALSILGFGMVLLLLAGCTTGQASVVSTTETPLFTPNVPEEPAPMANTYTLTEVSAHATANDCWTAIEGKVYDITKFIPGHPGGPGIIQACGTDGTTLFETRNGRGPHPERASTTLQTYYIGDLAA